MKLFSRSLASILALMILLAGTGAAAPAHADPKLYVSSLEDDHVYHIMNAASGLYLSRTDRDIVMSDGLYYTWHARKAGNRWYFINNTYTGIYLGCPDGKRAAGGSQAYLVSTADPAKDAACLWRVKWSGGKARLINAANSLVLGTSRPGVTGSSVDVRASRSAVNADWMFEDLTLESELRGHFALQSRDKGTLTRLTGKVHLILVFVSTPQHPWTDAKRREAFRFTDSSITIMEKAARSYGADLKMTFGYTDYSLSYEPQRASHTWVNEITRDCFQSDSVEAAIGLFRDHGTYDHAPILFLLNSEDRSYSYDASTDFPNTPEYSVFYCGGKTHRNYLSHEVYHLFGAVDLYDLRDGEGILKITNRYFRKNNMACTGDEMDPLTAYLLGWTDVLSDKAVAYLRETKGLR